VVGEDCPSARYVRRQADGPAWPAPELAKLAVNVELKRYVQDRLSGVVERPGGIAVAGPQVEWIGRRHGQREDRRCARSWSPEQISNRLRLEFPDDESMPRTKLSTNRCMYRARGALRRDADRRTLRVPRARTQRGKSFVSDEIMISERPAEAEDRAVPGHWEGDLILGLGSSAIGTLVERGSRFTMLLPAANERPRPESEERASPGWPRHRSGP
jgi:hypothetical protein